MKKNAELLDQLKTIRDLVERFDNFECCDPDDSDEWEDFWDDLRNHQGFLSSMGMEMGYTKEEMYE